MSYDVWMSEVSPAAGVVVRAELAGQTGDPDEEQRKVIEFAWQIPTLIINFHQVPLRAMAAAIADTSDNPPSADYQAAWKQGTEGLVSGLSLAGRDIKDPSVTVLAYRELTLAGAKTFWNGLAAIDPVAARGRIIEYRATMIKLMDELDKHFDTLKGSARDVMDRENSLSRQMTAVLADGVGRQSDVISRVANYVDQTLPALKDPAKWMRKTGAEIVGAILSATSWSDKKEMWQDFADKMSKPGAGLFKTAKEVGIPAGEMARAAPYLQRDIGMYVSDNFQDALKARLPDGTGQAIQAIGTLMDQIEQTASNYRTVRDAFLSTLPNHGSVLVLVSDTRRRLDKFINENGMDKIRAEVEGVRTALDAWSNGPMTSGLRSDAAEFADVVKRALQKRLDAAQASFDAYVTEFGNTFVASLNGPAERAVFDPSPVMDERGRLISLALDEKLANWRKQVIVIEPTLANYQASFNEAIELLPEEIQAEMKQRVAAAFDPLRAGLVKVAADVQAAMDREAALAGAAAVTADTDMSKLHDSLK